MENHRTKTWDYHGFKIEPNIRFKKNKPYQRKTESGSELKFCPKCESVYEKTNKVLIHYGKNLPSFRLKRIDCGL